VDRTAILIFIIMSAAYTRAARVATSAIYHHSRREKILLSSSRTLSVTSSWLHQPEQQLHRANSPLNQANVVHHNNISTTAYTQKSAMPLPSHHDDNDDNDVMTAATTANTNTIPFLLADIGEGISEVELLQWFVTPGERVSQFDRICEVQSDKANVEITSRFDGVVTELCGNVGEMMFVGKPLLYIAAENVPPSGQQEQGGGANNTNSSSSSGVGENAHPVESVGELKQQATLHNVDDESDRLHIPSVGSVYTNFEQNKEREGSMGTKVLSSPAVRKMSKEHNIDLGTVLGTGPGGRVLKSDILNIINAKDSPAKKSSSNSSSSASTIQKGSATTAQIEEDITVPIRGYNRLMVKSMTASLQVPHMVYADEINVNALTEVRDSLRPLAKEMGIHKLTYLPFFIKASSLALTKYPVLNSTIDVEEMTLTYHQDHNVGVAVDTERGLAVPVVKKCQDKSVLEIAEELNRLYSLVSPEMC
jgi:2-oxoisovalerate dehydrogenase E2 component (dihydrolipoyl transacylase)